MKIPFRTPAFEDFIAPARHYSQLWRLILGFALMGITYYAVMQGDVALGVVIGISLTGFAWADLTRVTGNIGAP